jgi:hypothetical protein
MAAATETNTATLYASNPTTSSSVGTSFSRLSFSCEGIPLLECNAVKHPKNPPATGFTVIFAPIGHALVSSEIDFNGIVRWIVGSFQKKSNSLSGSHMKVMDQVNAL